MDVNIVDVNTVDVNTVDVDIVGVNTFLAPVLLSQSMACSISLTAW